MSSNIKESLLKLRIVWGALCLPIFIHGFLLMSVLGLNFDSGGQVGSLVGSFTRFPGVVYFGLSILLLILSRLIPGVLFRDNMKKGAKDPSQILSFYWVSYLVGMIMLEGIGFLGLLLTVLENDLRIYVIFSTVALLNMLIRYPQERALLDVLGAHDQTSQASQSLNKI